jgi:hypothetical protein
MPAKVKSRKQRVTLTELMLNSPPGIKVLRPAWWLLGRLLVLTAAPAEALDLVSPALSNTSQAR